MPTEKMSLATSTLVSFVAEEIATTVKARSGKGQNTLILTCAGRTPRAIYSGLAAGGLTREEWATVHFGATDEFSPSTERPNTNAADLQEMFFREAVLKGLIPTKNIHWFDPSGDWQESIPRYEAELLSITGGINIVLLGAGGGAYWPGAAVDPGHVAGIMPGHPELWKPSESRFAVIEDSPKPPKRRMTLTAPAIWDATDLVLGIVTGTDKAGTVANYLSTAIDPVHCPIKVIDAVHTARSYFLTNVSIKELSA